MRRFNRAVRFLFPVVLLAGACSGRVVDRRSYNAEGKLTWSTVMPGSRNTALWLGYSLSAPVFREVPETTGSPVYDLSGRLDVAADGRGMYGGSVFLRPEGVSIDKMYSKGERKDVNTECGYSVCFETGRLKLMSLHEVEPGVMLEMSAYLPLEHGGAELISAELLLSPN